MEVRVGDLGERLIGEPDVWSAAVLDPAFPGRSIPASASLVLSSHTSNGWYPNPCLNVAAACSFSEWQPTRLASKSTTNPGTSTPPQRTVGTGRPASARSSQARSRAWARARFSPANTVSSTESNTRHAVAVDATAPNRPGWCRSNLRSVIV